MIQQRVAIRRAFVFSPFSPFLSRNIEMPRTVDDDDELIRALAESNTARVEFENSTAKLNLCRRRVAQKAQ
jgi:hypothetical protein